MTTQSPPRQVKSPELVHLDQSSPEWLRWRDQGIGASDAATVLGESPWHTPDELVQIKLGRLSVDENDAMRRGRRLEPEARTMYQQIRGIEVRPVCVVHPDYVWLRASLDGLSLDGRVVLEIKCPGKWPHHNAVRKGKVPSYYKAQIQHQLLVTGADVCHYFSYRPDDETVPPCGLVEVFPDREYQERLFESEQRWWKRLERIRGADLSEAPPPL